MTISGHRKGSEVFGYFSEYRGVTGIRGKSIGPYWAIRERERGCLGQAARPPRPSPNWTRGRGRAPSSLPFSFPLPCLLLLLHGRTPSWTRKGGILLPVGVGLPRARHREGRPSPPSLLYIRGQGAPHRHTS